MFPGFMGGGLGNLFGQNLHGENANVSKADTSEQIYISSLALLKMLKVMLITYMQKYLTHLLIAC